MSVRIAAPRRRRDTPVYDRRLLRSRAVALLRALGRSGDELSLSLVDDETIAALNQRWRARSGPTDVLSFSLMDGDHSEFRSGLLGEVVISLETAERQARRGRRSLDAELLKLLIHGVLHLLGHDHEEPEPARRMRAEERRLWRVLAA